MRRLSIALAMGMAACSGTDGTDGTNGTQGPKGDMGDPGATGDPGLPGVQGEPGLPGTAGPVGPAGPAGPQGLPGNPGEPGAEPIDSQVPLSAVVALTLWTNDGTGAETIPDYVKARIDQYASDSLPFFARQFPLATGATDSVRTLWGLKTNVVVKWLDPLGWDASAGGARFGANADYTAYFGDGWNDDWGTGGVIGSPPQWHGAADAGFMWVNHEYVSGSSPRLSAAPNAQHLTLAKWLRYYGVITGNPAASTWTQANIDAYLVAYKQNMGGSWLRIVQDPSTLEWTVDHSAPNKRYDSTSATQSMITGTALLSGPDHTDDGTALPAGVASGFIGDCSGAQTPWGTVISGEENVQDFYGDLEACWDSANKLLAGKGCDAGAFISLTLPASTSGEFGTHSSASQLHARDLYGYLIEVDPGQPAGEYLGKTSEGVGHRKLGALGRARWENATFVVDADWELTPGKPIVMYSADDRRSGRIYKWVSSGVYTAGMTRAQVRGLLDAGHTYVAHFAGLDNHTGDTMLDGTSVVNEPGQWIELSLSSTSVAPNAAALGQPGKTVAAALADTSYNGIGGFDRTEVLYDLLFTAANKLGVMELNRPEDLEWNPRDPSGTPALYVAFTKNGAKTALDQQGKLIPAATHAMTSVTRPDKVGSLFALRETGDPATSTTFTYTKVWNGTNFAGLNDFDVANPDNIMIDHDGGVWFGTDGNFGTNGHADALYYLDLDPAHLLSAIPTFGLAFRIASAPSDAEFTGPSFSSDMRTIFFSVQHPGEGQFSAWPPR